MKELELTSNAALTDVVYEAALNGSLLNVKLVTGAVGDDEIRGLIPEANHYHVGCIPAGTEKGTGADWTGQVLCIISHYDRAGMDQRYR